MKMAVFFSALTSLSVIAQLVVINQPVNVYDEGFVVSNADRILRGEIPYRDFWADVYPPGQSYILSILFKFFSTTLRVERLYDIAIRTTISVMAFVITARLVKKSLALIPWLLATILLAAIGYPATPVFPAFALILVGIYCYLIFFQTKRKSWLVASAISVGLSALMRHDTALMAGAIIASALLFDAFLIPPGKNTRQLISGKILTITWFVAIAAIPFSLLIGYLISRHVSPTALVNNLLVLPFTVYLHVRSLPYPSIIPPGSPEMIFFRWLPFYFPLLVSIAMGIVIIINLRQAKTLPTKRLLIPPTVLTGLSILTFWHMLRRADALHRIPAAILGSIVLMLLWPYAMKWRRRQTAATMVILPAVAAFIYTTGYIPTNQLLQKIRYFPPFSCHSTLPRAGCAAVSPDQEAAVLLIQDLTSDEERLFVGNSQHDQIFVNDMIFYFLANRPAGTRYHHLYPGLATTLPVQKTIAAELADQSVNYIVLYSRFAAWREPNQSGQSSGVTYLDDFIRANYDSIYQNGFYEVLKKRA